MMLAFLKIICYFCPHLKEVMNVETAQPTCTVGVYTKSEKLPALLEGNFFHSREFFCILEKTPGCTPLMAVAVDSIGRVTGQLLVILFHRHRWFPPYLYTHAHAHEEGIYADGVEKETVFAQLLSAVTRWLDRRLCLYVEFSGLKKKMFGYSCLRREGYFPIAWQEVHNSLHSMPPEDRLDEKMIRRIKKMRAKGVETRVIVDVGEVRQFYRLLKRYYRFKPRRHIPSERYFEEMQQSSHVRIFLTEWRGNVIGGCACVYSGGNAYLWYLASKRKSYMALHPDLMTMWAAIEDSYKRGFRHIYFMDVGLPWRKNPFRDFILSFGGKPVAKYRWFRFYNRFVNAILAWFYKDR